MTASKSLQRATGSLMRQSLTSELHQSGWRSSILTTYSVDSAFYERLVAPRFRAHGCENNILLADAAMLEAALNMTPEAFRDAGRRYALVPVATAGAFHPKISLRFGADRARLVVGSANVTAAGWARNQEIIAALTWTAKSASVEGGLVRKAFEFLSRWLDAESSDAIAYKLDLLNRESPWLADLAPAAGPVETTDGAIDLLLEAADGGLGILRRFADLTGGDPVRRLIVVSPYWDADLSGLRALQSALGNPPTIVGLHLKTSTFPSQALTSDDEIAFADVSACCERNGFLHAKLFIAETQAADHVLFGSANCSDEALGRPGRPAVNVEASVYRRLPPGAAVERLALDLGQRVVASTLEQPQQPASPPRPTAPAAGVFELDGVVLTWRPPTGQSGTDAVVLAPQGLELPLEMRPDGRGRASLPEPAISTLAVKVRYADGRVSRTAVVHDVRELRRAAPGPSDARINRAIDKVIAGEADLIDLALEARNLFAPEVARGGQPLPAAERKLRAEAKGRDYVTPEEFREAMGTGPAAEGLSGRFLEDAPALREILAIMMRGVAAIDTPSADRLREHQEAEALSAGEDDEETDEAETGRAQGNTPPPVPPAPPKRREFTRESFEQRRTHLCKSVARFEAYAAQLSESVEPPAAEICMQTVFFLKVLIFACTHCYTITEAGPEPLTQPLLTLAPTPVRDNRSACFAIPAVRVLQKLWLPSLKGSAAPINRLRLPRSLNQLPDDVFFLIVMTRWSAVRARLAVADQPGLQNLERILGRAAAELFEATLRFGTVDRAAEEAFVARLDEALGFTSAETEALLTESRRFVAANSRPAQTGEGREATRKVRKTA